MRQMGNHQAFWLACKFLILKQPLVFPELNAHHCHVDFKLLEENKNLIIPRTFYHQLLNKGKASKIFPDLNNAAPSQQR